MTLLDHYYLVLIDFRFKAILISNNLNKRINVIDLKNCDKD